MASLAFDFDDQLSEDWISQPRSSDGAFSPRSPAPRSSILLSRIPVPTKPAGAGKQTPSAVNTPNKQANRPLHIKSKSELNIPLARNIRGGAASPVPKGTPKSRPAHKRSSSVQSWRTDGTVQHFGSEVRHAGAGAQMTPEWKKRLLKGQGADDKDLFSPIGLEGVFRPPSASAADGNALSPKRRHALRCRAESSMVYPSSPPPYPSTRQRRSTNKSTSPSPLRDHAPHDSCTGQGGKCEGAKTPTPTPTHKKVRLRFGKEEGAKRGREQNVRRGTPGQQNSSSIADHESISPVTISRGRIDYRTIQASVLQLRDKMEELGIEDQKRPSSRSSDHGINYGYTAREDDTTEKGTSAFMEDSSVLGSDMLHRAGTFVRTRRGGYSSDDNFHRKPLSPSSFQFEQSEVEPKSNIAPLKIQRTRSSEVNVRLSKSSPLKPKSSGSPLKLFGKHDTYTNNHLMRRLSQYVGDGDERSLRGSSPPSPSPRRSGGPRSVSNAKSKKFGDGKLNTYPFSGSGSMLETDFADSKEEEDGEEPSLPPVLPPKDPVKFLLPSGPSAALYKGVSRAVSKRLSSAFSTKQFPRRPSLAEFRNNIRDSEPKSDGKRTMLSPGKSHQSKRRRTLLSSVGSPESSVLPDLAMAPLVIGKKRKDTLPAEEAINANAKVIASRTILRPRSLSPQQPSSPASAMSSWLGAASVRQASRQEQGESNLDQSTKILAEDLASFALNVAQSITKGERKASVTTADFFKEANIIMQHLRGQTPIRSGRTSGEVSYIEPMPEITEQDESSSREQTGKFTAQNLRNHVLNAGQHQRVISRLNKFKEQDEPAFSISASVRNLHIAPELVPDEDSLPASDANIRIIDQTATKETGGNEEEPPLTKSSAGHSTARSIRTGSSGNSKKFNIAPETVRELLSDRVGRMVFDHQKGVWVRNKSASIANRPGSAHMSSDFTEDDPLKSIPDLEDNDLSGVPDMRSDSATSAPSSNATVITRNRNIAESTRRSSDHTIRASIQEQGESRPSSGHEADSSQYSKLSKFGSSQAAPDTRATSWSTQPSTKVQNATVELDLVKVEEAGESSRNSIIPLTGGPLQQDQIVRSKPSAVAFSSPLTTVPDEVLFEKAKVNALRSGLESGAQETPQIRLLSSAEQTPVRRSRVASALARNKDRAKNHLSIVKQRYSDRPVSRIEERDEHAEEKSGLQGTPETSLMAVTPEQGQQTGSKALSLPPPSTGRHSKVAFHRSLHLDILSDFTIHQADESLNLDVNYVRQRHNLSSDAEVDSQFSLAVRELVARVTDIEPFEPYWEYISRLELSGRKLMTLHMLEDFCPRIEELTVDQNELGQLNGAPEMLRGLSVRNNCLTDVTSWGHLQNLHYLDASNNKLGSLKGFEGLIHIRELTLNNNQIDNLDGLENLRGLIKLRLRGNNIGSFALSGVELPHLIELDLSDNELTEVKGLECLPNLERLDLHGNKIHMVDLGKAPKSLVSTDLSRNCIVSLNVSALTGLRSLNVDSNCLAAIDGLSRLTSLATLSWRAQNLSPATELTWTDACEVQELALSGNRLDLHHLGSTSFPSLKCLDLSCCGLDVLPTNFGRLMPNVRYLNLNYNGLREIKPLIGASKLKELYLAGNRIGRLRNTATVLERIGRELEVLDLRNNGLTLGFYAANGSLSPGNLKDTEFQLMTRNSSVSSSDDSPLRVNKRPACHSLINVMSNGNSALDRAHRDRLDESTSMRRRVFELLAVHYCPHLQMLDGLDVCEDNLYGDKDRVWNRLVELKIVKLRAAAAQP